MQTGSLCEDRELAVRRPEQSMHNSLSVEESSRAASRKEERMNDCADPAAFAQSSRRDENSRRRLPLIVASAAALLFVTFCTVSNRNRDRRFTSLLSWSPETAMVQRPRDGEQESKSMLQLYQQQQWANHFNALAETRRVPDPMLSSYMMRDNRYPDSEVNRASIQLEQHPPLTLGRYIQLSDKPYAPRSSFDDPGDFLVHQHYEYVPPPEGKGMTDQEGAALWKQLQRGYRADHPSTTTHPAVPVVFGEDQDGGHPLASGYFDEDDLPPDSRDYQTAPTTWHEQAQGPLPQLTSSTTKPQQESAPDHTVVGKPEASARAEEKDIERDEGKERKPLSSHSAAAASHSAKVAPETPEEKLWDWERAHHVDDKAAYAFAKKHPSQKLLEEEASQRQEEEKRARREAERKQQEQEHAKLVETSKRTAAELSAVEKRLATVERHQQKSELHTQQLQDQLKFLHLQNQQHSAKIHPTADSDPAGTHALLLGLKSHLAAEKEALRTVLGSAVAPSASTAPSAAAPRASVRGGVDQTGASPPRDPVPAAVVAEAREMIKDKVATELASAEEASDDKDANFIMGSRAGRAESPLMGGRGAGFNTLHRIEEAVLERISHSTQQQAERAQQAAEAKAKAKASVEAKRMRDAKVEETLHDAAVKGHRKQLSSMEAVRDRALQFVRAFGGANAPADAGAASSIEASLTGTAA